MAKKYPLLSLSDFLKLFHADSDITLIRAIMSFKRLKLSNTVQDLLSSFNNLDKWLESIQSFIKEEKITNQSNALSLYLLIQALWFSSFNTNSLNESLSLLYSSQYPFPFKGFIESLGYTSLDISGNHNISLNINSFFLDQLDPEDFDILQLVLTTSVEDLVQTVSQIPSVHFPIDSNNKNGRTLYITLKKPIFLKSGTLITILRIKGSTPQYTDPLDLPPHLGNGYVKRVFKTDSEGRIIAQKGDFGPQGTLLLKGAIRELAVMQDALGSDVFLDFPVGFGQFKDLMFKGQKTGFVIAGMTDHDFRLNRGLNQITAKKQDLKENSFSVPEPKQFYQQLGLQLRKYHDTLRYAHRYPHRGNIGLSPKNELFLPLIRDLDTSKMLDPLSLDEERTLRMLDILRIIHDILQPYERVWSESSDGYSIPYLLAPFLKGYFYDLEEDSDAFLEMLQQLNTYDFTNFYARLVYIDIMKGFYVKTVQPHIEDVTFIPPRPREVINEFKPETIHPHIGFLFQSICQITPPKEILSERELSILIHTMLNELVRNPHLHSKIQTAMQNKIGAIVNAQTLKINETIHFHSPTLELSQIGILFSSSVDLSSRLYMAQMIHELIEKLYPYLELQKKTLLIFQLEAIILDIVEPLLQEPLSVLIQTDLDMAA